MDQNGRGDRNPATPRPQAEDANLFRLLVGTVIDYAIFLLTPDGHIASWNAGAERLKGYAPREIIGHSFERFYTEADRSAGRPQRLLAAARADGRVEDVGWRVRKDGTRFWADVVITALHDESGQLVGFAKVTRDLTERRQSEADRLARAAAERTAQRMERLQAATVALSAANRPEAVADVLVDIAVQALGASAGMVGMASSDPALLDLVTRGSLAVTPETRHEQLRADGPDPLAYAWRTNHPLFVESRAQLETDHPSLIAPVAATPFNAWAMVPLTVGQRQVGLLALSFEQPRAFDADEQSFLTALAEVGAQAIEKARLHTAERQAREHAEAAERVARDEAQVVETLHRVSLAVSAELDLETAVQAVTDAATSVTGAEFGAFLYNVTDLRGEGYTVTAISGAARAAFQGFPLPRNTAIFEPTFRGAGTVRSGDITRDPHYGNNPPYAGIPEGHPPVRSYLAVPVISKSGLVLGGLFFGHQRPAVFTERSERLAVGIAAQAAVAMDNAHLYQQVQNAVRTRDEFLAAAAHDLKTPLAATKGIAQILKRRIERMQIPAAEQLTEGLARIDQSVQRMNALIDELLDLARLQMGRPLDLDRKLVDMVALVRQVLDEAEPNAPRHTLTFTSSADHVFGMWDPVRLRRVIDNLVSNAIKYSPTGGEVNVCVSTTDGDAEARTIEVRVSDHGVGIPAEDLPHIFERFRRGGNVGLIQGTGIGLGIAQNIVQLHGGTIGVTSIEGQGTTFVVRLATT